VWNVSGPKRLKFKAIRPGSLLLAGWSALLSGCLGTGELQLAITDDDIVYPAPKLESITPAIASIDGGVRITLEGADLRKGLAIEIDGTRCQTSEYISLTRAECVVPALSRSGLLNVTVRNVDQQQASLEYALEVPPAPNVTLIQPNAGILAGGNTLVLTGSGFQNGATVTLGNGECTNIEYISPNELRCLSPIGTPGPVAVSVRNGDAVTRSFFDKFQYRPLPTITSAYPSFGRLTGRNLVTFSGTGFLEGLTLTIDGEPCTSLAFIDAQTFTCYVPPHAAGGATLTVTNPDTQQGSLENGYIYTPPLTLSGRSPSNGALAGGNTLTLFGTGFNPGAMVLVGTQPCANPTVIDPTRLTCTLPPNSVGMYNIDITTLDGQNAQLLGTSGYSYNPFPTLTATDRASGYAVGGAIITLTGTGFMTGATILVGGVACTSTTISNSTTASCVAPPLPKGIHPVNLRNPDGQGTSSAHVFEAVPAPSVASISPNFGALAGGVTVTLQGAEIQAGAIPQIGGQLCTQANRISATTLQCVSPSLAAGSYNVTITNPDGQAGTLSAAFTHHPFPTLGVISPSRGSQAGGGSVTLTGTGFLAGATVQIGALTCTNPLISSSTALSCTPPAQSTGAYPVTVTNPDGQSVTLANAYTYDPAPAVTSASPNNGRLVGGGTITVTGSGFQNGATVRIRGTLCTSVAFISVTSLNCIVPSATTGMADITVTNPDAQSGTLNEGYRYNPLPTISGVSPSSGSMLAGNTLTILGTGFLPGASVTVNTSPATTSCNSPIPSADGTQITCTTGAMAVGSSYGITVTNADTQSVTRAGLYSVTTIPFTSVSPNNGTQLGGTLLTLTGGGFVAGATVTMAGNTCSSPTVVNSTTITCLSPARSQGLVSVVINNGDGQIATLSSGYRYNAAPTLTAVSPSNGLAAGGQTLNVTGSNFISGATLSIGGTPCTTSTWISSNQMTCVNPPMPGGTYNLVVTNPDLQHDPLENAFAYNSFTITSVSPPRGKLAGGDLIAITGTDFPADAVVTIGGTPCASTAVVSNTSIHCQVPASTAGPKDIMISSNSGGSATAPGAYIYDPFPTISSLSPASGRLTGGVSFNINGSGFLNGAVARIGGVNCLTTTFVNATRLSCVPPANVAGAYDVEVINPDTQSVVRSNGYTYNPVPTLTSVSPNNGRLEGLTTITLTGTGFLSGLSIRVGSDTCTSVSYINSTSASCRTPARPAGTYSITITNSDTQNATLNNAYTYNPLPTVTSVSPTNGRLSGGTSITVTGTGFLTGATATVRGVACTSPVVTGPSTLTCLTPANAVGTANIVVTNPDGQIGTGTNLYTYNPLPTLGSISPNYSAPAGGTLITINGSNFMNGASVTVGGSTCTSPTHVNSTQMTCLTPTRTHGSYTVAVINPDTQQATLASGITYHPVPTLTSSNPTHGSTQGGYTLSLQGTGFLPGVTVTVGGITCSGVSRTSSTSLSCVAPSGTQANSTVAVTNPDTQTGSSSSVFGYREMTDAYSSGIYSSAALVPSDGVATTRIIVVPRKAPGQILGSGRHVKVEMNPAGATFIGGSSCEEPSSTCRMATEISPGIYAVRIASLGIGTHQFTATVAEAGLPTVVLQASTSVEFDSARFTLITQNTTLNSGDSGRNLYITGGTTTFDASTQGLSFGHIFVSNATLTHEATNSLFVRKIDIQVESLNLLGGSLIDASALGYLGGGTGLKGGSYGGEQAPSQAISSGEGAGASHGGRGGYWNLTDPAESGLVYGNYIDPRYPGGGAHGVGPDYVGGGVVRIQATGYCSLDTGSAIRANASPTHGGAGGSISLSCAGFTGSASGLALSARGGDAVRYYVSGGGGGRIALRSSRDASSFSGSFRYPNGASSLNAFKSLVSTRGGLAYDAEYPGGGSGTVYLKHSAINYGDLIVDNERSVTHPADGTTDLAATTVNNSLLHASAGGASAQVTAGGMPFAGQEDLFKGFLLQVFALGSNPSPLHVSHINLVLSGNTENTFNAQAGIFPAINANHHYRFVHRFNHIDISGYARVNSPGGDIILDGCDLHSASLSALHVPTGSRLSGNALASPVCTAAEASTLGTTIQFGSLYLQ
jgi:hypothetical protein